METTAQNKRKHIGDMHFGNTLMLNQLAFYKEELAILTKRLEELASKNTKQEVTSRIEQFQNQFIRQREVNDELRHKIKMHEEELADYAQDHPVAIDHVLFKDDEIINAEMESYTKLYNEMKHDFIRLLSEWL